MPLVKCQVHLKMILRSSDIFIQDVAAFKGIKEERALTGLLEKIKGGPSQPFRTAARHQRIGCWHAWPCRRRCCRRQHFGFAENEHVQEGEGRGSRAEDLSPPGGHGLAAGRAPGGQGLHRGGAKPGSLNPGSFRRSAAGARRWLLCGPVVRCSQGGDSNNTKILADESGKTWKGVARAPALNSGRFCSCRSRLPCRSRLFL